MNEASVLLPLFFGVFGAVVGSFLNVVIYRLPREDLSVSKPRRSFCPRCGYQISWRENIPLLSWLLLGGRCRGCKASIPARYPAVEVLTAFLFGAYAYRFAAGRLEFEPASHWSLYLQAAELLAGLFVIAACVVVTFIDIDFKIIPDQITWPGMGLGVALSLLAPGLHEQSPALGWASDTLGVADPLAGLFSALAGLLVGAVIVLLVGWLGRLVFRQEAMGLGDVKFMAMAGAFLGWDGVLVVFFVGCMAGAVGGLVHRALTGTRYIAFGPYLSLGTLLVLFFRAEIIEFLRYDWPHFVQGVLGS